MTKAQEAFMAQLRRERFLIVLSTNRTARALEKQGLVIIDKLKSRMDLAQVKELCHSKHE